MYNPFLFQVSKTVASDIASELTVENAQIAIDNVNQAMNEAINEANEAISETINDSITAGILFLPDIPLLITAGILFCI